MFQRYEETARLQNSLIFFVLSENLRIFAIELFNTIEIKKLAKLEQL